MRILILLLFFISTLSFSQSSYKTKNPEKAKEYIDEAIDWFAYEDYSKAWKLFSKVDSTLFDDYETIEKVGRAALYTSNYHLAVSYLKRAETFPHDKDKKPEIKLDIYTHEYRSSNLNFNIARACHLDHLMDEAIEYYTKTENDFVEGYGSKVSKYQDQLDLLANFKKQCSVGKAFMSTPVKGVEIENMGEIINSEYSDFTPLITADEKYMIFTSRRKGSTGGHLGDDGRYMEDIYMTKFANDKWRRPWRVSTKINSEHHDACVGLSIDGQKMFIFKSEKLNEGDIYETELKGRIWTEPVKLINGINMDGSIENGASISADGKTLVFTSNREGGKGGFDIYISRRPSDGQWEKPVNLGENINTSFDEESPFLHADGLSLYFSSKGHNTMGGYDIFKSIYNPQTKTWSKAVNLGYPINSAHDDVFYVWTPDGNRAYFSTQREGGFGEQDIYRMKIPNNTNAVVLLKGEVKSKNSGLSLTARVTIYNNKTGDEVASTLSNEEFGDYVLVVPPGENYGISVEKDGYITHSGRIELPDLNKYYEKEMNVKLELSESENLTILQNVLFEQNKAELKKESYPELSIYAKMLLNNKNLDAEVVGHTEPGGLQENNMKLSFDRAQAVIDYLVYKGIDRARLVAKGYGAQFPVTYKKEEDLRAQNRRTEIIIHDRTVEGEKWTPYYEK